MSLRDRHFEKAIQRRLRKAIAASRALRRETKRVRPPTSLKIPPLVARLVMTGILAWAASVFGLAGANERVLSAFAIVVALVEALWLAGKLPSALYDMAQLAVLTPLPIADQTIFRRQWRVLVHSGVATMLDLAAIHLVIALRAEAPPATVALGCVIGVLQGVGAFALGTLLGAYRWRPLYQSAGCLGFALLLGVAFWGVMLAPWLIPMLDFAAPVLFCVPPVGWFEAAWHFGVRQGSGIGFALLLPALVLTTLARFGYRRVKANYCLGETIRDASLAAGSNEETPEPLQQSFGNTQAWPEATPEQIKFALAEQPDWSRLGPLERLVQRWLTSRERSVAWFLASELPSWSKSWKRSMTLTLIALGGSLLPNPVGSWALGILAGLSFAIGVPLLGGAWPGFSGMPIYGAQVPCLAFLPVGFREASRAVFKANLVRCSAFLPQALLLGVASKTFHDVGLGVDLFLGLKLLLAVISLQPIAILFKLSQATNDTSRVAWRGLVRGLVLVVLILLFLVLSILMLVLTEPLPICGLLAGMIATALAGWAYYARCYDRMRFDLVRANQQ